MTRESYELASRYAEVFGEAARDDDRIKAGAPAVDRRGRDRAGATVAAAVAEAGELRRRAREEAEERGVAVLSAGTHPFSRYEHQDVTEKPRYAELVDALRWASSGSSSSACTSTSGSRRRIRRSRSRTRCGRGCRSCSRRPRTRRSGTAATRVSLDALEGLRRDAAQRPPAGVRVLRGVRAPRRARRQHRLVRRLHVHLVGPASASRVSARSRSASATRRRGSRTSRRSSRSSSRCRRRSPSATSATGRSRSSR